MLVGLQNSNTNSHTVCINLFINIFLDYIDNKFCCKLTAFVLYLINNNLKDVFQVASIVNAIQNTISISDFNRGLAG